MSDGRLNCFAGLHLATHIIDLDPRPYYEYFLRSRPLEDPPLIVEEYSEMRLPLKQGMFITYPARPHSFIEFSLADPYEVGDTLNRPVNLGRDVTIFGPHVHRLPRTRLSGIMHEFYIGLQPTALHRLCRVDLGHLTDQVVSARDVIGWRLDALRDGVMRAPSFEARIAAADRWFAMMLEQARPIDAEDAIAYRIRRGGGRARIDMLRGLSGYPERHWRRRFEARVGMSPKTFTRVTRLDSALTLQQQNPDMSWTDVALAMGYYDHLHMLRDARDLLHVTPAKWIDEHPWPFGTIDMPRSPAI